MPCQTLSRAAGTQFNPSSIHLLSAEYLESHKETVLRHSNSLGIKILNQQNLVAVLSIDKLVNQFLRQQHPESTGTHALLFPVSHVTERVFGRVGDSSVWNLVQGKTRAWVVDLASHHVAGADVCNLNILRRIEATAMLDGIQQHLAKGHADGTSLRFGQVRDFVEELQHPLGGLPVTANQNAYPFGRRRSTISMPSSQQGSLLTALHEPCQQEHPTGREEKNS